MPEQPRAPETEAKRRVATCGQGPVPARRRFTAWLALGVIALAGFFSLSRFGGVSHDPATGAGPARSDGVRLVEEPGVEQHPSSPRLRLEGDFDGVLAVRPGDVIHVEASQLPRAGDVEIEIDLVEASADAAARPVRVYRDGRLLTELRTQPLEGDRTRARLTIPAETFGVSAKYVIEVVTTEKSHFPLRRYAIEVR